MNRKLEPQTIPVSTNCTATDAFDGPRGSSARPLAGAGWRWRGCRSAPGDSSPGLRRADPIRGCRVRNPPKRRDGSATARRQGPGARRRTARKRGLSRTSSATSPMITKPAEQGREPQRGEGRERAGVERAEARSAGDHDDEHALQSTADRVGHRGLHHRVAEDRADVVGAARDDEGQRGGDDQNEVRSARVDVGGSEPSERRRAEHESERRRSTPP